MRILVHGDKSDVITFTCTNCGCIFQANRSEFDSYTSASAKNIYVCFCPECKKYVESTNWGWFKI